MGKSLQETCRQRVPLTATSPKQRRAAARLGAEAENLKQLLGLLACKCCETEWCSVGAPPGDKTLWCPQSLAATPAGQGSTWSRR